ncbi:MAG: hypothetical protein ACLQVI_03605 [Polyangiaceae bacterium]
MTPTDPNDHTTRPETTRSTADSISAPIPHPDVVEVNAAIKEGGAASAPEPTPPTAPATSIPEVAATAGETDIEARVRAMPQDERLRVLHGILVEVARWYRLVERKVRSGRVWKTVVEVEFDPRSRLTVEASAGRRGVSVAHGATA